MWCAHAVTQYISMRIISSRLVVKLDQSVAIMFRIQIILSPPDGSSVELFY